METTHKENNMFTIVRHPQYSSFIIKREGKGPVPTVLGGTYTHQPLAKAAIETYIQKVAIEEAAKVIRDAEHEANLKKPLGHTQEKTPKVKKDKPDAKKPSTPRKQ